MSLFFNFNFILSYSLYLFLLYHLILHTTSPKSCGLTSSLSCKLNALLVSFSQVSLHLIIIQCNLQIFKPLIIQISAISISYKCMTCVCVCVCVCVCARICHLTVLWKVQNFVSGMLTLSGHFPIMSLIADITYQRWIAVIWENISRKGNEDLEKL